MHHSAMSPEHALDIFLQKGANIDAVNLQGQCGLVDVVAYA
jgi:hypothetical protein